VARIAWAIMTSGKACRHQPALDSVEAVIVIASSTASITT
jgi:hypothetical protein